MRRWFLVASMFILVACNGAGSTASSEPSLAAPATPELSGTTTTSQAVITPPTPQPRAVDEEAYPPVLLANADGVFLIRDGLLPGRLLDGRAEIAIEDTLGGIIFQRTEFEIGTSTIFQLAATNPTPTAIATPTSSESLSLAGAVRDPQDDDVRVWFSRWSGTTPETITQSLFRSSLSTGEETEVATVGGWNSSSIIRPAQNLIVAEWRMEDVHGIHIRDFEWTLIDVSGNPYPVDGIAGCTTCPITVTVSDDGAILAFLEQAGATDQVQHDVVVTDLATGRELTRVQLGADAGPAAELDLHGGHVLLNSRDGERDAWAPPLIIDLDDGAIQLLPHPGRGRLVRRSDPAGGLAVH